MGFNDGILPNCLLDNFLSLSFKVSIYFSSYLNKPGAIVVLMAQLIISMEIRYVSRVCFFSLFYHLSLSFFKVKAVWVRSTQVFNLLRHSCLIIYNKMLICSNIKWIRSKAKWITASLISEIRHMTGKYRMKIQRPGRKRSKYIPLYVLLQRDLLERTTNRLIIKPCTFLTKQQATPLLTGKQLSDQKRRNMEKNFLDNSDKHVIAK